MDNKMIAINKDVDDAIKILSKFMKGLTDIQTEFVCYRKSHSELLVSVCGKGFVFYKKIFISCIICDFISGFTISEGGQFKISSSANGKITITDGKDFVVRCEYLNLFSDPSVITYGDGDYIDYADHLKKYVGMLKHEISDVISAVNIFNDLTKNITNTKCTFLDYNKLESRLYFSIYGDDIYFNEGVIVGCISCEYISGLVISPCQSWNINIGEGSLIGITNVKGFIVKCHDINIYTRTKTEKSCANKALMD